MGFVDEAEDGSGEQFLVVAVLPDRSVSLRLVADVDKLLRRWAGPARAVPVAVFQVDRERFCEIAGIEPVFPQTVGFEWAASYLSKAPVVPSMIMTVLKHVERLDKKQVAEVLVAWAAVAPAAPRLRTVVEDRDPDWRDYADD